MSVDELTAIVEQQRALLDQYRAGEPQGAAPQPNIEIGSVTPRLPTFWMTAPELWFAQTEANFENRHPKITTDASKYAQILQALPQEVLMECEHAITNEGQERYRVLKEALIKAYGKSRAKKSAELLAMAARPGGLGDRKPSNLLMKIRNLSGSSYEALERAMFLNQLPPQVRTALASSKAATNDELATEADAVVEEFNIANESRGIPQAAVNAVQPPVEVDAVSRQGFRPQPQRRDDGLCYMHKKFGARAYFCRSNACPMRNQVAPQGNGNAGR